MEKVLITTIIFAVIGLFIGLLLKLLSTDFLEDDECKHHNTFTRVSNVSATCETTTVECLDCGKQLRKPKTDCR